MKKYYRMLVCVTIAILLLLLRSEYLEIRERSKQRKSSTLSSEKEKVLVFCSPKDKGMVFQNFYQGLRDGNERLGGNVEISIYERKSGETMSEDEYVQYITQAIAPDYLLINGSSKGLIETGIPYFCYDGDIVGKNRMGYVGTENYQAGYQAGEEAARLIPEKEVYALVLMLADSNVFRERAKGFQDAFSQSDRLHVKAIYNINGDFSRCRSYVENLLQQDEETAVNLIFCEDSVVSGAVAELLCENDMGRSVKVIGMDLNDNTRTYLEQGQIQVVIDQNYYQAGLDLMELIIHKDQYSFPVVKHQQCRIIRTEDME